jgi:DNA-binding NarL/FixJ family response regulator
MLQRREGLQLVGEVSDGQAAVQKASEVQPDLILLDIGLPKLNGIEAAKEIHQVAPGAQILFVTAISDADVVQAALSNGAKGFVLKRDTARELLPAIESVLRGKRYVSNGFKLIALTNSN